MTIYCIQKMYCDVKLLLFSAIIYFFSKREIERERKKRKKERERKKRKKERNYES